MPKKLRLVGIGLVLCLALAAGGLVAYWRIRANLKVKDYLVKSEVSGKQVLLAEAVSWDERRLRLKLIWQDKDKTEFEWRVDFNKTFIMIPSNMGGNMPLMTRKSQEFETAFCQGDKLELEIDEFSGEKKIKELTGE